MTKKLLALALAASIALPVAANAAEPVQPRIIVTGEGEMSVAPDMALLSLSVMREAPTAREALDANNSAIAAVISAMKAAGIAERDLQTSNLQINPRYDYVTRPDGTQEGKLAAYQHAGFWQPMDTVRERNLLEGLWATGKAPWQIWK